MLLRICMIGLVSLIPLNVCAQAVDFNWLVGKWKLESDRVELYEEWKTDGEHRLKGESYVMRDGQKQVSEILFVEKFDDQWAYIALPEGQSITLFALVQSENNEFVFENKEHDFPQRIIYRLVNEGEISATVEGNKDGEPKTLNFKFAKVK